MAGVRLSCVHTTIRSQLSVARSFGFLGALGMRLEAGEQVMIPGDAWDMISTNKRKFDGLQNALARGDIAIVRSPQAIVWDDGADSAKTLKINSGTLSSVDPCWGAFHSTQT